MATIARSLLVLALVACGASPSTSDAGTDAGCAGCIRTDTPFPVCGTNHQTYTNPGFAACACVAVAHDGQCLVGEGAPCSATATCMPDLDCVQGACTAHACSSIGECPTVTSCAGGHTPSPRCDGACHACG